jgi:hypothetical protein
LCGQLIHRRGERRTEEFSFAPRDEIALARSMEEYFDALHGTILLKANNGVNRPCQTLGSLADCGLGAAAHTIGNIGMMGVKDYFHF